MDFSWHITILGHFLNSATLVNFSTFLGNIFCMSKLDIHTNLYEYSFKIEGNFFSITLHNSYTNEKLALCRLKTVKGYLLSYLYYFVSSESSSLFLEGFLEESQPWWDEFIPVISLKRGESQLSLALFRTPYGERTKS